MVPSNDHKTLIVALFSGAVDTISHAMFRNVREDDADNTPMLMKLAYEPQSLALVPAQFIASILCGVHPAALLIWGSCGCKTMQEFLELFPERSHDLRKAGAQVAATLDVRFFRKMKKWPWYATVMVNAKALCLLKHSKPFKHLIQLNINSINRNTTYTYTPNATHTYTNKHTNT